jgi:hypothetical protein
MSTRPSVMGPMRHGVLLVFGAPCQHRSLAGQEHGRTMPLADMRGGSLPQRNMAIETSPPTADWND